MGQGARVRLLSSENGLLMSHKRTLGTKLTIFMLILPLPLPSPPTPLHSTIPRRKKSSMRYKEKGSQHLFAPKPAEDPSSVSVCFAEFVGGVSNSALEQFLLTWKVHNRAMS